MSRHSAGFWTLYMATFPNGKVYIGITSQNLKNRIQQHSWYRPDQSKRPMFRALKLYAGHVKWETILTFDKMEDAIAAEIAFIADYDSTNASKGYNLVEGGQGCSGLKRHSQRICIIDNSGNKFMGYQQASEHYGITESSVLASVAHGYYCGLVYFSKYEPGMERAHARPFNRDHRKVVDLTNGIIFFNVQLAASYYGISSKSIGRVCSGARETTGGIKFKFLEGV